MNLAAESASTRRDAFAIAGEKRGLLPLLIEKDYWVCWTLERLFTLPEFREHLLFKGGTSLSKVYGLIQRFSEDIDISLSRAALGEGLSNPEQAISNTQRKQFSGVLVAAFQDIVTHRLLPALRANIMQELGESGNELWTLVQDTSDPGTLHFAYPRAVEENSVYIRPEVKIEMGGRNDDWPAENKTVTAYVAKELPQIMSAAIPVRVLAARRTFWEKATILHAEYHRPPGKALGERLSRHYSDVAQMAGTEVEDQALADLPLLERVRQHKSAFYTAPWASYETARPGTLCLVPRPERLAGLRTDYRGMSAMFFAETLSFEAMMDKITALEQRINAS